MLRINTSSRISYKNININVRSKSISIEIYEPALLCRTIKSIKAYLTVNISTCKHKNTNTNTNTKVNYPNDKSVAEQNYLLIASTYDFT